MDSEPILAGLDEATKKWARQRKAEEKSTRARQQRETMWRPRARALSLKDICYQHMPEFWERASGGLPTYWRQVYYVARPVVDAHPHAWRPLTDKTFKGIFDAYIEEHRPGWDVLYGARGVLKEPHTNVVVPLGTADVRSYLRSRADTSISHLGVRYPTKGSRNRFGAILICEKEGFDELLNAAKVPERFDVALMSTKGISAKAARALASSSGVRCFTLHDFDKNGFVMKAGFTDATDIGLRLTDIDELELEPEEQQHSNPAATRRNLIKNGATDEEADFISNGQRVELNALTSPEMVEFVERKLDEHDVEKVIPDAGTLAHAWRRAHLTVQINALIEEQLKDDDKGPAVPDDLEERLRAEIEKDPASSWDEALHLLIDDADDEDEGDVDDDEAEDGAT